MNYTGGELPEKNVLTMSRQILTNLVKLFKKVDKSFNSHSRKLLGLEYGGELLLDWHKPRLTKPDSSEHEVKRIAGLQR